MTFDINRAESFAPAAPSEQPATQTIRNEQSVSQSWTVQPSDRVSIVYQANLFVSLIHSRQIASMGETGLKDPIDNNPIEQKTYDAALEYLRKSFEHGAQPTEQLLTQYERSQTIKAKQ